MKRLGKEFQSSQVIKPSGGSPEKKIFSITPQILSEEEAIEAKEKMLNTKILGFSPVHYTTRSVKKVYVPFELITYSYNVKILSSNQNKQTGIVYTVRENHAFHFDLNEKIDREKIASVALNGEILKDGCKDKEILENSMRVLQQKILRRVHRNVKDLKMIRRERFYRPACEMVVECRGKEFIKYAYMDAYASSNEHVSGLKTRL